MMRTITQTLIIGFITFAYCLGSASAGDLTIPNTFTDGTKAVAAEVNDNFSAAKTAVDDNNARINDNAANITVNTTQIGANSDSIGTNTTQIGTNTGNIATNTTQIGVNTGSIGTNTTQIGANTGNIAANTTQIANQETLITNNTAAIQNKQNRVTGQCLAGYSIRAIDADGNVACESDDVTVVGLLGYSQPVSGWIDVDALGVRDLDPDTVLRTISFVSPADGYVMVTATGKGCIHTDGGYIELFLRKGADYLNYINAYSVRGAGTACAVGESSQFSWQYIEPVTAGSALSFNVSGHKGTSATISGNVIITSVAAIFLPGL